MSEQNINQVNNEQNVSQVNRKKDNDTRNIILTFVGVFVLLAAVSGGTFAYYAYSATDNVNIAGTAASASITLSVNKLDTTTKSLVPQKGVNSSSALLKAVYGSSTTSSATTAAKSCVDGYNNDVCNIYSIKIENNSTAAVTLQIGVNLCAGTSIDSTATTCASTSGSNTFANLKWATLSNSPLTTGSVTIGTPVAQSSTISSSNLVSSLNLIASSGTHTYYIVTWIEETGSDQTTTDVGSFVGLVKATDVNGNGLTSTFTS